MFMDLTEFKIVATSILTKRTLLHRLFQLSMYKQNLIMDKVYLHAQFRFDTVVHVCITSLADLVLLV